MTRRVVDLGEVLAVHDGEVQPELWISPAGGVTASPRLIEAFARGEVTVGGLAEAGWRNLGKLDADGVRQTPCDGLAAGRSRRRAGSEGQFNE